MRRRGKRLAIATTLLIVVIVLTVSPSRLPVPAAPALDLGQALQRIASDAVKSDRSVRNCVLAAASGDASFAWSGAAGFASESGRVAMTGDTPCDAATVTAGPRQRGIL